MKKLIITACILTTSLSLFAASKVKKERIQMEMIANKALDAEENHFLLPNLEQEFTDVSGKIILDTGCKMAAFAMFIAEKGASVCGVDHNNQTVQVAKQLVTKAGFKNQISFVQAEECVIPYEPNTFDKALSINTGRHLTKTMQTTMNDQIVVAGLGFHFNELARVLKAGGRAVITAPASFDVVFTDGSVGEKEVELHIENVLARLNKNMDHQAIERALGELKEVNRATFFQNRDKLVLVKNMEELEVGQTIWQKVGDEVVQTYFHSEEEYLSELRSSGLFCEEIKRPCFFGKVKHDLFLKSGQKGLGSAYISNHPFTIYYVVKQA